MLRHLTYLNRQGLFYATLLSVYVSIWKETITNKMRGQFKNVPLGDKRKEVWNSSPTRNINWDYLSKPQNTESIHCLSLIKNKNKITSWFNFKTLSNIYTNIQNVSFLLKEISFVLGNNECSSLTRPTLN